jgi:hypothetical protein
MAPPFLLSIVVLGDGYADTAKQSHLATTFFVCVLILIIGFWTARLNAWMRPSRLKT